MRIHRRACRRFRSETRLDGQEQQSLWIILRNVCCSPFQSLKMLQMKRWSPVGITLDQKQVEYLKAVILHTRRPQSMQRFQPETRLGRSGATSLGVFSGLSPAPLFHPPTPPPTPPGVSDIVFCYWLHLISVRYCTIWSFRPSIQRT